MPVGVLLFSILIVFQFLRFILPFFFFLACHYYRISHENITKAHIKSSLIGASVSIPITNGELALGTWQGIWFLEFRNGKQRRKCLATIQGERV